MNSIAHYNFPKIAWDRIKDYMLNYESLEKIITRNYSYYFSNMVDTSVDRYDVDELIRRSVGYLKEIVFMKDNDEYVSKYPIVEYLHRHTLIALHCIIVNCVMIKKLHRIKLRAVLNGDQDVLSDIHEIVPSEDHLYSTSVHDYNLWKNVFCKDYDYILQEYAEVLNEKEAFRDLFRFNMISIDEYDEFLEHNLYFEKYLHGLVDILDKGKSNYKRLKLSLYVINNVNESSAVKFFVVR